MPGRATAILLAAVLTLAAAGGCSDDDDASPPTGPTTSSIVFAGDPASPFCTLLRDLQLQRVLDEPSQTPADVEAGFTRLLGVLDQAADLAPAELRTDTALLLEGVAALDDALRAVGYSYPALAESPEALEVSAAVNDPAFAVAGDRIEAYKAQVCGL